MQNIERLSKNNFIRIVQKQKEKQTVTRGNIEKIYDIDAKNHIYDSHNIGEQLFTRCILNFTFIFIPTALRTIKQPVADRSPAGGGKKARTFAPGKRPALRKTRRLSRKIKVSLPRQRCPRTLSIKAVLERFHIAFRSDKTSGFAFSSRSYKVEASALWLTVEIACPNVPYERINIFLSRKRIVPIEIRSVSFPICLHTVSVTCAFLWKHL